MGREKLLIVSNVANKEGPQERIVHCCSGPSSLILTITTVNSNQKNRAANSAVPVRCLPRRLCPTWKPCAEVVATDAEGMIREGRELAAIDEHIVVKVPFTREGVKACKALSSEGKRVNVTLRADGSCSVEDDGRGIPVDVMKDRGVSAAEVVMTVQVTRQASGSSSARVRSRQNSYSPAIAITEPSAGWMK